jgi:hypothetical protein
VVYRIRVFVARSRHKNSYSIGGGLRMGSGESAQFPTGVKEVMAMVALAQTISF